MIKFKYCHRIYSYLLITDNTDSNLAYVNMGLVIYDEDEYYFCLCESRLGKYTNYPTFEELPVKAQEYINVDKIK